MDELDINDFHFIMRSKGLLLLIVKALTFGPPFFDAKSTTCS